MGEDKTFETWLEGVCKRALPTNKMAQMRTFAKELAEGVTENFWNILILSETVTYTKLRPANISHPPNDDGISPHSIDVVYLRKDNQRYEDFTKRIDILSSKQPVYYIVQYLQNRWEYNWPSAELLEVNGYLKRTDKNHIDWEVSKSAFDLLEEVEPVNIFISYKRSESSAFAMYMLTRLKIEGLEAFVDMSLIPGEDWHAGLKERIKEYDYLVVLTGKETLKSDVCIKEIGWAIEAGLKIIPVWHNLFEYKQETWNVPPKTAEILTSTHSIRVKEESASGYNTAMVELLNVFGITP